MTMVCPHCKDVVHGSSEVDDRCEVHEGHPLAEEDISMCFRCGDWSVVHDGKLCRPTNDELEYIRNNETCKRMVHAWLEMTMERYRARYRERAANRTR